MTHPDKLFVKFNELTDEQARNPFLFELAEEYYWSHTNGYFEDLQDIEETFDELKSQRML